ncbi:MAG: hypothetical protein ACJAVI_005073 [Candidatus Azotimanducaceae bacterium]|jgi:uncharacterized protein YcfJ
MKMKLMLGIAITALASTQSFARGNISYDYATVIDADPVIKIVKISTPREECWEEEVVYRDRYENRNGALGPVLGGVIGGALGNAVGHKKKNKQVGAVIGAVLGATLGKAVADSNANRRDNVSRGTEERCKVYHDYREEERIVGYQVRYRYNDETYSTRTDIDPGDTIKIRLAVTPVL